MTAVLELEARHEYPGGFSLDVALVAGEGVTATVGPSGSGKSTTLRIVAGLLRPRHGRLVLGGEVLLDTCRRRWVEPQHRGVGLVFQDSLLFPHRDVRANLSYGLKRRPAGRVSFDRVVEVLELAPLLRRYPSTLSGGEARRVAIGRALLRGPRLLLLDEPWSGLDDGLRERITALVQHSIDEWRIPTLLVSHDVRAIEAMADRTVSIDGGRMVGRKGAHDPDLSAGAGGDAARVARGAP